MKKGLIFALVAVTMMLALAGCGADTQTEGGVAELLWYAGGVKQQDHETVMNALNEQLEEKIGVNLDLQIIDWGSYGEKMNMIISSGEVFDLCFTSSWANDFVQNASGGGYAALDEYLEGKNKGLYEAVPDFLWDDAKMGGNIYAVPNYQVVYVQECILTPKRLADKYNLDPSTIKVPTDIEPYLKQLQENEPDIYPLNPSSFQFVLTGFDGVRGVPGVVFDPNDPELKLFNLYEDPAYMQKLQIARDWYNKGYIRSDVLSATKSAADDVKKLRYGVWTGTSKPGGDVENLNYYGEEILEIPVEEPYVDMGAAQSTMTAVSVTSKNPAKAVDLLELLNTDTEAYNLLCFGIEGTHYNKVTDKTIKSIEDSGYDPAAAWVFGNQFNAYYMEGQEEGTWEETDAINRGAVKSPLRGMTLNLDNIKNEVAKVNAVENEFGYLSLGAEDPEKAYQEFLAKLKSAGIDKLIVEVQKQVDEFLAQQAK